jgi:hypothetical protein
MITTETHTAEEFGYGNTSPIKQGGDHLPTHSRGDDEQDAGHLCPRPRLWSWVVLTLARVVPLRSEI